MYSRGDSVLEEEKTLKELHEIREKLYNMDKEKIKDLLRNVRQKYKDLF